MLNTSLFETAACLNLVITRDDLLAKRFEAACLKYYRQQKKESSLTIPNILSLVDWATRCFQEEQHTSTVSTKQLLNAMQTISVWEGIISAPSSSFANFKIATLAYEAWNFCKIHNIDYLSPLFKENPASQTWQAFARQFDDQSRSQNQLDFYSMMQVLIQSRRIDSPLFPKKIGLLGFHSPTSLEQQLFTYLKEQGCLIEFLSIPHSTACSRNTVMFNTAYDELNTMAHWAYQTLHQHLKQTIICLIPNLRIQRTQVVAAFQRAAQECTVQHVSEAYPLSLPLEMVTFDKLSIIQTALGIINLEFPIRLTSLSALLRSPYLGDAYEELSKRSQLDRLLHQKGNALIAAFELKKYSEKCGCAFFLKRLGIWESKSITLTARLPSQWVEYWRMQLDIWGWPSIALLSEEERYYYTKWFAIIEDFATLDSLLDNISYQKALSALMYFITYTEVPLQPTCPLEAIQLIDVNNRQDWFGDTSWILNAHQAHYTQRSSNPFIPYRLQQSFQSPVMLSSILEAVSQQGNSLIVSSTQSVCLPTNTTNSYIELHLDRLVAPYTPIAEKMNAVIQWESFEDQWAPPLLNPEVAGGSDLIKKQAICPFRAFSDYRLMLNKALTMPSMVPTTAEKATYLHRVLESIWEKLKTQQQLNQLSEMALDQLLHSVIDQEMQKHSRQKPYLWQPTFTKLEKEKVYTMVKKWLTLEKKRPSFVNKSVEYPITGILGPLTLRFTIDRIDELSDGSLLLIDYKSSKQIPTRQNWMSSRPVDPQLPLYLLSMRTAASGITWVHMHPEYGGKFLGISADEMNISGIQTSDKQKLPHNWEALRIHWRLYLEKLAHQFSNGYAAVDPKDGSASCRYCQYELLCRVNQPDQ